MESPNLNPRPDDRDDLAALLRRAAPVLPDDGFSARVLQALPPRAEPHWLRSTRFAGAVGAGTLGGIAFAVLRGSTWRSLADGLGRLSRELTPIDSVLRDPNFALALVFAVSSLLLVYLLGRRTPLIG